MEGRGNQGLEEGEPGAGACRGWARGLRLCCQPLPAGLSLRRSLVPWLTRPVVSGSWVEGLTSHKAHVSLFHVGATSLGSGLRCLGMC